MRYLFAILGLISVFPGSAQVLFVQSDVQLTVGKNEFLSLNGDAILAGSLDNQGEIESSGHLDFRRNLEVGALKLTGFEDQVISGGDLLATRLEINKNGRQILACSSFKIVEELVLNAGILSVHSTDFSVESGNIFGGSSDSFVEGKLRIHTDDRSDVLFPVGINNSYLPLTFHDIDPSILSVEVVIPDPEILIPGDSLIGLSDEALWAIENMSSNSLNATISVNYEGLDLQNYPHHNPIRANLYAPVPSIKSSTGEFKPLGRTPSSSRELGSTGFVTSTSPLTINDSSAFISIGVTPLSDGLHFYVPLIVTPSGSDPRNRAFRAFLVGTQIQSVSLKIWDRINNLVFNEVRHDVSLEQTGWNGLLKNQREASQGVYYYTIELQTSDGEFAKQGTFFLAR